MHRYCFKCEAAWVALSSIQLPYIKQSERHVCLAITRHSLENLQLYQNWSYYTVVVRPVLASRSADGGTSSIIL